MKLRYNFIGYPYFNTITGHIQPGHYDCDSVIKIAEMAYEGRKINPILLPTYHQGDKFSLKKKRNIAGHKVIFYGRLFNEENYSLIRKYCRSISKAEAMNFIVIHSKELTSIFKEEYNLYMLRLIFELDKIPDEFEITYQGKIIDMNTAKKIWKTNKKDFELLSYKK